MIFYGYKARCGDNRMYDNAKELLPEVFQLACIYCIHHTHSIYIYTFFNMIAEMFRALCAQVL